MSGDGKRDLKFLCFAGFLLLIAVAALAYCAAPKGGTPPLRGNPPLGAN